MNSFPSIHETNSKQELIALPFDTLLQHKQSKKQPIILQASPETKTRTFK